MLSGHLTMKIIDRLVTQLTALSLSWSSSSISSESIHQASHQSSCSLHKMALESLKTKKSRLASKSESSVIQKWRQPLCSVFFLVNVSLVHIVPYRWPPICVHSFFFVKFQLRIFSLFGSEPDFFFSLVLGRKWAINNFLYFNFTCLF